ncbi:MAG TPA: hypothetical protein VJR50_19035 [Mycobacterium sp.]|nr:hypothetical protein [Mycobacterium sp.]
MDEAVWEASTPREKVLLAGLTDWVELAQVHSFVAQANPDAPTATIQNETLDLIRALADEGLVVIGDLTAAGGRFAAWNSSTEDSLRRIRGEYVDRFDDRNSWPWYSWLDLTDKGQAVAESVERKLNSSG